MAGAGRHHLGHQPGQRVRGLRGDHLADGTRLEPPGLPPLGVEQGPDQPGLHEDAVVGDGAERRDHLQRGDRHFLTDRHRRQRQHRPALGVPQHTPALARQAHARRGAEAEGGHVTVVPVPSQRQPDLY